MTSIHVRRLESRVARTTARLLDLAARERLTVADLATARLPWYTIRDEAGDDAWDVDAEDAGAATVFIFDEIGGSLGISAKTFAADLEAITAPRINVRINSPGGSVFDAIAIHSALLHHPARIRSYVDGIAASAASVIAMAADPYNGDDDSGGVVMMPGSQMMIHDASAIEDGNAADHSKMSTFLARQSDNIAELYRQRAGGDTAEWRELMLAETWMFADEAVEMRLADRVETRPPADAGPDDVMTRSHDLGQWHYRYAGRRAAPAPARRRQAVTHTSPRRHSEGTAMTTPRSHATMPDLRSAAQARAAGAQQAGYRMLGRAAGAVPPAGRARSLPFAAQLRATLEDRRGQQLYHLAGQASVFGVRYEMWDEFGPYWEKVHKNAADDTLAANPDVAFLVNHRGVTMARTTNGTLELAASTGLDFDAWLNPKRQDVSDLVIAIEDRNVTETSFAFMLDDGVWNEDFTEFEITRFDLNRGDVSAVNYGANPYTSISARQREVLGELERMSPALGRAAVARLMQRSDLGIDDLFTGYAKVRDLDRAETVRRVAATDPVPAGRSISHIEALLLDD